MINTESFKLAALSEYKSPKYPTHSDALDNPALLKKLPSRWKKNLSALACIGLLGAASTLGGCTNFKGCAPFGCPECGSVHFGGSGVPAYVVYLTEQEAIDVIRNKAQYLGLEMNDTPPDISVTVHHREVGLDLFNEEKNIAFSHVGVVDPWWDWSDSRSVAMAAQQAFDKQEGDLAVGVFYSEQEGFWGARCPSDEMRNNAREDLKQHLAAQVREFVEWLQAQGIVQ